jgi:hypothetical protein
MRFSNLYQSILTEIVLVTLKSRPPLLVPSHRSTHPQPNWNSPAELREVERAHVLAVLDSPRFADKSHRARRGPSCWMRAPTCARRPPYPTITRTRRHSSKPSNTARLSLEDSALSKTPVSSAGNSCGIIIKSIAIPGSRCTPPHPSTMVLRLRSAQSGSPPSTRHSWPTPSGSADGGPRAASARRPLPLPAAAPGRDLALSSPAHRGDYPPAGRRPQLTSPEPPLRPGRTNQNPWNPAHRARQPGNQARPEAETATRHSLRRTDQDRETSRLRCRG